MISNIISTPGSRLYHSGEKVPGMHLVDLNMYDSSLFANVAIVHEGDTVMIFDAGTSRTAGQIINYMKFYDMDPRKVFLVPSHHHFDHAGGLSQLITYFERSHVKTTVITTPRMAHLLEDLPSHVAPAKKQFRKMMGDIQGVPRDSITTLSDGEKFSINESVEVSLLKTPGHCKDHVSPIVVRDGKNHVCFFGEAMGINLRKHLSPLPACAAPSYYSRYYIRSIQQISNSNVDVGIFSHVGGVMGRENIKALCQLAIEKVKEVSEFVKLEYENGVKSTKDLVTVMAKRYIDYIATCVMDEDIVNNLAFLLVFGIMKDLGLK
ncbi:MAG: MBL fold metallo-hydrolase [Promethearchaeota archaeon]